MSHLTVPPPDRPLAGALRAFLAQAHAAPVDPLSWRNLSSLFLRCLHSDEPDHLIATAYTALHTHRPNPPPDWPSFCAAADTALRRAARPYLADRLSVAASAQKRHTPSSSAGSRYVDVVARTDSPPRKRTRPCPPPLYAFHLLRTQGISADPATTLCLQDVLTAGADLAVLCNFKYDIAWLWNSAPALATFRRVVLIHGEDADEELRWKQMLRQVGVADRVHFVRPTTPPYGTVHSKLFVLFYSHGCRVCVHTANMIQPDWECKTQGAYMRDFPLADIVTRDNSISGKGNGNTSGHDNDNGHVTNEATATTRTRATTTDDDFREQLEDYLQRCLETARAEDRQAVLDALRRYDFRSAGVALVTSVPGKHSGPDQYRFGHARLRRLLERESVGTSASDSAAILQFSSLGSIQEKWLTEEFANTLFAQADHDNEKEKRGEIKLIFPTIEQVEQSNEGVHAGGSLPVPARNVQRAHITERLHRWDAICSGRERAMPHIKTIVRYANARPDAVQWIFLGSFNLSVAAWGRMQGARGRSEWNRLNVLSYEVGVLVTPWVMCAPAFALPDATVKYGLPCEEEQRAWEKAREEGVALRLAHVAAGVVASVGDEAAVTVWVPLPYGIPPRRYAATDAPWTIEQCRMN